MITTTIDFPEKPGYPKSDIIRVQEKLLEMADVVTSILDRHSIRYFLTLGSLLGAVRHGGFIPWDDDFDLMLFDDQYEKALDYLRSELPDGLIVHDRKSDPIFWPGWSRVRDVGSSTRAILWPDDNAYKYTGINLDLYRVKKMRQSDVERYRLKEHIEFLVRKHTVGLLEENVYCEKFNKLVTDYADVLGRDLPTEGLDPIGYSCAFPGFKFVEEDDVFPLVKYQFCGRWYWGPNNASNILSHIYGDYMKLPAYEKRLSHYDTVNFGK